MRYTLRTVLVFMGVFFCISVNAQTQNPASPFKIEISLGSTLPLQKPIPGKTNVIVMTKLINISNQEQEVTTLGCSDNWITDSPFVTFAEACMSTSLISKILKPNEYLLEKHFLSISGPSVIFRIGFRNLQVIDGSMRFEIKTPDLIEAEKIKGKLPAKYMGRTWSNPITIKNY